MVIIFQRGSGLEYFVLLLSGIIHYNMLFQTLSNSSSAIYGNAPMLLQIKLEPLVLVAASFVKSMRTSLVGIPIFLFLFLTLNPIISFRLLAYPLILVLWIWLCWSLSILAATASVYSRDLEKFIPFLAQILMYLSPVIFSVTYFPTELYDIFLLNPIAVIFALLQWCFVGAPLPPTHSLLLLPVSLTLLFYFAHWGYARGRRNFTKAL